MDSFHSHSVPIDILVAFADHVVQMLIAYDPELLLPPEEVRQYRPSPTLLAARTVVALTRELHFALAHYRDLMLAPQADPFARHVPSPPDDDIPF
jgi:hypothetical protein